MIVSPRGLIIYLPKDYAFALMARLYPKVDAFKVLEKTQGISKIHSFAAFLLGLLCFLLALSPLQVVMLTAVGTLVFYLIRLFRIFFIPGLIELSTIYSRFTGFGILTIALLILGIWRVGIWGALAFFATRFVMELFTMLIDSKVGSKIGREFGVDPSLAKAGSMYYAPIGDFIGAYRIYASRNGITKDLEVTDHELEKENWIHVWEDLEYKWPEVARRYPKDE